LGLSFSVREDGRAQLAAERTVASILKRFETEQDFIRHYVEFIRLQATVDEMLVVELNESLLARANG
jgi:hypothetical protein